MSEEKKDEAPKEEKPQEEKKTNDPSKDYYKGKVAELEQKVIDDKKILEDKIIALKREKKELQDKPDPEPADSVLSEEEIEAKLDAKVEAKTAQLKQEILGDKLNEIIVDLAKGNEDVAKLIMNSYENDIKITGDIKKDVANANAIVQQGFMQSQSEEQQRTNNSNDLAGKGGGAGQRMPLAGERPLTADEKKIVAGSGLKMKDGKLISPAKEKYREKVAKQFPNLEIESDFE